jgi:hypothetical protein
VARYHLRAGLLVKTEVLGGALENKEQSLLRMSWNTWLQCVRGKDHERLVERERP